MLQCAPRIRNTLLLIINCGRSKSHISQFDCTIGGRTHSALHFQCRTYDRLKGTDRARKREREKNRLLRCFTNREIPLILLPPHCTLRCRCSECQIIGARTFERSLQNQNDKERDSHVRCAKIVFITMNRNKMV